MNAAAQGMEVEEHLGRIVPLELDFTTSDGKKVFLKDYFTGTNKPAVVAMVWYKCPIACQVVMEKFAECLNAMDLELGKDFRVLYFSIDPVETPELAKEVKDKFLLRYNKKVTQGVRNDWQFHVGDAASAKQLSESLGFPYRPDGRGGYAHPVALFVLSPEGKVVRYIHGFNYPPRDVKLALMEASSGRLGKSLGDRLMGFCYMYDPATGKYTLVAMRVMQVGGIIMILGLGSLVGVMLVSERVLRKQRARLAAEAVSKQDDPQASVHPPEVTIPGNQGIEP